MLKFPYFETSDEEAIDNLEPEEKQCSICGRLAKCFRLNYYWADSVIETDDFDTEVLSFWEMEESKREYRYGCFECLRQGRFTYVQSTEIGTLDRSGLRIDTQNAPELAQASLDGLLRTPHIRGWHYEVWLVHCGDFMVYLGDWQPQDFTAHDVNGHGSALFTRTIEKDKDQWNATCTYYFPEEEDGEWNYACHTFRCTQCGELRAIPEAP